MTVIYEASEPHRCDFNGEVTGWSDKGTRGSIIYCEECGTYWRRGRVLFTDGYHLTWKRVHWWNFHARRIISHWEWGE